MEGMGFSTQSVHGGEYHDYQSGAIVTPIFQSSAFHYPYRIDSEGRYTDESSGYMYTRTGNPTVSSVERKISLLEHTDSAVAFSSGMAAISSSLISMLGSQGHILSVRDLYGGTATLFSTLLPKMGHEVSYFSNRQIGSLDSMVRKNTRVVYVETPTNPTLEIYDIREIFHFARERGLVSIVDNTLPSPVNLKPADYDADIVVHSATKYLSGHSDLIGGLATGGKEHIQKIRETMITIGSPLDPFAAFLLERGMKTLELRVKRQNENATAVAEFLMEHARVAGVHYPGLSDDPGHEIAGSFMKGYGGLLSFEIRGGAEEARKFLKKLRLIKVAPSFGSVESLATLPVDTSHRQLSSAELKERGISESLVRLSAGIEDEEDLIEDISFSLKL